MRQENLIITTTIEAAGWEGRKNSQGQRFEVSWRKANWIHNCPAKIASCSCKVLEFRSLGNQESRAFFQVKLNMAF